MTNEELDRARAEEALRIAKIEAEGPDATFEGWVKSIPEIAARLTREGWRPPEPLIGEARKIAAAICMGMGVPVTAEKILAGNNDQAPSVRGARDGLERGIEIGREQLKDRVLRDGFIGVRPEIVIPLNESEIQSGLTRVRWAEILIRQLPADHEGRNSWLLNYGAEPEFRQEYHAEFVKAAAPVFRPKPGDRVLVEGFVHSLDFDSDRLAKTGEVLRLRVCVGSSMPITVRSSDIHRMREPKS